MDFDFQRFKEGLDTALETFDWREVDRQVDRLIEGGLDHPEADPEMLLGALRRKRRFETMEKLAEAWRSAGRADPVIVRQLAQALVERGGASLTKALGELKKLERRLVDTGEGVGGEATEARGLMGRVYKQLYVSGGDPEGLRDFLTMGVDAYLGVYRADEEQKPIWHGINAVALLCRARRDGLDLEGYPDPLQMAEELLGIVTAAEGPDPWAAATAMEACIALGRNAEAFTWLSTYLQGFDELSATARAADAFEFASTLRQLEEVWTLTASSPPGNMILPSLKAALLGQSGGSVEATRSDVRSAREGSAGFEKNLGLTTFRDPDWFRLALSRAECVAKISEEGDRTGTGTGFVVPGELLHERYQGASLLLTNAHVVSADQATHDAGLAALWPEDARVSFQERGNGQIGVKELLCESHPSELDFAVLLLDEQVEVREPYRINERKLPTGGTERVYVIGHPGGGDLAMPIDDNLLLELSDTKLHYRTPTEGGSSGSPVFDSKWRLVGLHHYGGFDVDRLDGQGKHDANEGIRIGAIRQAIHGA